MGSTPERERTATVCEDEDTEMERKLQRIASLDVMGVSALVFIFLHGASSYLRFYSLMYFGECERTALKRSLQQCAESLRYCPVVSVYVRKDGYIRL